MAMIFSLNLSDPKLPQLQHAPFEFGDGTDEITSLRLPEHDPIIVYILAHAVPNALRAGQNDRILPEAKLVTQLKLLRPKAPTLLIFDACFSASFLEIAGIEWPSNFGLIFSCSAWERTWHTATAAPANVSQFSVALNAAIPAACAGNEPFWTALQRHLVDGYGGLQHPLVKAERLAAADFGFCNKPAQARAS
jgi:hypothetical protein